MKVGRSIRQWLLVSLLNSTFGGTSDRTIGIAKDIIDEYGTSSGSFPLVELTRGLRRHGTFTQLDEEFIESILNIEYKDKRCFLALSLIHQGRNFGDIDYHIDHIFPKSLFTAEKLRAEGISDTFIPAYQALFNRVGNLQLLSSNENTQKSSSDFKGWILNRTDDYKVEYCIPNDETLYEFGAFIEFIKHREELLKTRLQENLTLHSEREPAFPIEFNAKDQEPEVFF